MLTGICPNCGTAYRGWALNEKRYQNCPECGSLLKVMEYDKAETQNSISRGQMVIEERPLAGE